MALVGISAATSLMIGVVLYFFAESRLVAGESNLLIDRSQTANTGAGDFLEGLRNPADQSLPKPDTYAKELVRSVADPTGLGVLYIGPNGNPLAARNVYGNSVNPEKFYEQLGLNGKIIRRTMESSQGWIIPRSGWPRYVTAWPLTGAGGDVHGVMVYSAPQDELRRTLSYLRYGILGAIATSVLLAGLASLLLTRQITRPLAETRDAAIRIASGDYGPMPIESQDELGELARSFNYMAEEVERYVGEIQEQKSRLEAVLEASPEAVVTTDLQERVTMANPAAARMLGIRPSDFNRPLAEIGVSGEILQCLHEAASAGVALREIESEEQVYWTYAARMGREDAAGTTGIIIAVRNITEHRSLEKSRTAFVSDVSHELRTPLTTIQSAVDLVERARDRLDPLEHRALELADQELRRIRGMVEELLTLSQMDSLQYALEAGPADLGEVIRNAVESLQTKAERFGIEINFVDGDSEHQCVCDATKLYQVFLNLLDNAIKYSDAGARVDISITEDDSLITVKVKDTGVGIPEEDIQHLFERFYRVNKDRSRATGGSGLGLAISKEMVELHGGKIWAESEADVGSTFTVQLPKSPLPRSANYAM